MNIKKRILKFLQCKKIKVGILGQGYVGLPLSMLFDKKGIEVYGFDTNKRKINLLKQGKSFLSSYSNQEIKNNTKNCKFFNSFEKINDCNILIICVPTPLKNKNKPDLSYLKNGIQLIKKNIRSKMKRVIVLESTSYPGTTNEHLIQKFKKENIGKDIFIGFSPERINPGINEKNLQLIPKVVSGYTYNCLEVISQIYRLIFKKVVKAKKIEEAEFSKVLENIFRSVNIGFINEMKTIADKMKLDIFDIIKLSATKPFGFTRFDPGPGVGGHCIPIDPIYLSWKAKQLNMDTKFINLSAKINISMISFIMSKVKDLLKNKSKLQNYKILILGLSYKRNTGDLRESSSLKLIEALLKNGYRNINFHDPYIDNKIKFKKFNFNKKPINLNEEILKKSELVILLTDHNCFNYEFILKNSKKILDCRGRYKTSKKVIRA